MAGRKEKDIPIYRVSVRYAIERNETELYMASFMANVDCARLIATGLKRVYHGNLLISDVIPPVVNRFGYERPLFILANTIWERYLHLAPISRDNMAWVMNRPVSQDIDAYGNHRNRYYVVDFDKPRLIDRLLTDLRKHEREHKPSIREQLAEASQYRYPLPARWKSEEEEKLGTLPLIERIKDNFSDYCALWKTQSASEILRETGFITAVNDTYAYLTDIHKFQPDEVDFLLQYDNPLEFLAKKWEYHVATMEEFPEVMGEALYEKNGLVKGKAEKSKGEEVR